MRLLFILLLPAILLSCTSEKYITYTVQTQAQQPLDPKPGKVIVLSTYDPATSTRRKNIEGLNKELSDSVVHRLAAIIHRRMDIPTEALTGITVLSTHTNPVGQLLEQHGATHAIVITFFDVAFEQTRVDVTKSSSGKSREAYYDMCNTINFELYNREELMFKNSYPICSPHSSRMVISGLLAAGPSYQSNKKDFEKLSYRNSAYFLRLYFPCESEVTRPVFIGGEFKPMESLLDRNDLEGAIELNRRIAESSKARIAAMALYNCAVLSERRNDFSAAQSYLMQSMSKAPLEQADVMARQLDAWN